MDKKEFMEGINILQDNYNKKFSVNQLKLFYENLKDLSKETYLKNINDAVRNNKFMPNVAELRNNSIEQRKQFADYEQREYENIDFNKFYAN